MSTTTTTRPATDALRLISGFADYTESEQIAFDGMFQRIADVYRGHGFNPFFPRPLEPIANLCSESTGEDTNKQIYTVSRLENGEATGLGLPFDRTVPLAVWVGQHHKEITFPFKRFDMSHSFRGEHASKGRYRAFVQADVDIVDRELTPLADAEAIATAYDALVGVETPQFVIYINHIEIARAMVGLLSSEEAKKNELLRIVDKMDKHPPEEIVKMVQTAVPDAPREEVEGLVRAFAFKGDLQAFVPDVKGPGALAVQQGLEQLKECFARLEDLGVDPSRIAFCPGMVRGLAYYSGIVFETFLKGESFAGYGSIASGGRYDNLVSHLASDDAVHLGGVGISIGLTRLFDIFKRHHLVPTTKRTIADVLVVYQNGSLTGTAAKVAAILRKRGLHIELYTNEKHKLAKQLSYASRKGFSHVFLVNGEGAFAVKRLGDGSQKEFAVREEAVEQLVKEVGST